MIINQWSSLGSKVGTLPPSMLGLANMSETWDLGPHVNWPSHYNTLESLEATSIRLRRGSRDPHEICPSTKAGVESPPGFLVRSQIAPRYRLPRSLPTNSSPRVNDVHWRSHSFSSISPFPLILVQVKPAHDSIGASPASILPLAAVPVAY